MDDVRGVLLSRLAGAQLAADVIRSLATRLAAYSTSPDAARRVAAVWREAVAAAPRERLLPLVYVVDALLQTSRGETRPLFQEAYALPLQEVLPAAARRDPAQAAQYRRLTAIWESRQIYSGRFMARLGEAIDAAAGGGTASASGPAAPAGGRGSPGGPQMEAADGGGGGGGGDASLFGGDHGAGAQEQQQHHHHHRRQQPSQPRAPAAAGGEAVAPPPSLAAALTEAQRLHRATAAVRHLLFNHPLRREMASGDASALPDPALLPPDQRAQLLGDLDSAAQLARLYSALTKLSARRRPALLGALRDASQGAADAAARVGAEHAAATEVAAHVAGLVSAAGERGETILTVRDAVGGGSGGGAAHPPTTLSLGAPATAAAWSPSAGPSTTGAHAGGGSATSTLRHGAAVSPGGRGDGLLPPLDGGEGAAAGADAAAFDEPFELDPLQADDAALLGLVGSTAAAEAVLAAAAATAAAAASSVGSAASPVAGFSPPAGARRGARGASPPGHAFATDAAASAAGAAAAPGGGKRKRQSDAGLGGGQPPTSGGSAASMGGRKASRTAGEDDSDALFIAPAGARGGARDVDDDVTALLGPVGGEGGGWDEAGAGDGDGARGGEGAGDGAITGDGDGDGHDGHDGDGDDDDVGTGVFQFNADDAFAGKEWDPVRGVFVDTAAAPTEEDWREH